MAYLLFPVLNIDEGQDIFKLDSCVYFTFKFTVKSICTSEIMFSEFFSYDNSVLVDNWYTWSSGSIS